MSDRKKMPRDLNQLAANIVEDSINEDRESPPAKVAEKNKAAVELGRKGGKKGGKARAEKLTHEQRSEIARLAAQARWKKNDG